MYLLRIEDFRAAREVKPTAHAAGEVLKAEDERLDAGPRGHDLGLWCGPSPWACWPARKGLTRYG